MIVRIESASKRLKGIWPGNSYKQEGQYYVLDTGQKLTVIPGTELVVVPDQDISHLYDADGFLHGTLADLKQYTAEEKAALIDRETGHEINIQMHQFAPLEEQIGILRDQLVHVLNALGIEPTKEFARLNEIAIQEIEAARKKKEAIDAKDDAA